jgi:tRNA dimethylallyltransferase
METKTLHATDGLSWKRCDRLGLEYRYIARFLQGLITEDEMAKELFKEICRYAKRQMTWFKRNKTIAWVKNEKEAEQLVEQFLTE